MTQGHVRRRLLTWTLGLALLWAGIVQADDVVLHEFIPADPGEDVELAATTPDGRLPAAIETRSGTVEAPDTARMPTATEKAYGPSVARSVDSTYRPDRDTRRPTVSRYDDPFSPATAPYKRLRAFDAVAPDYTLTVQDPALRPVPVGGLVRSGEDAFFGDMTVDLVPGEPVRIPTVGPGSRVVRMTTQPTVGVELVQDGADNWFMRGSFRTRVRWIGQIAIARDSFGGTFPNTSIAAVRGRVVPLAPHVMQSVEEVARALGLMDEPSLRAVVTRLVAHFRAFEASDQPPRGRQNIYLDLALSRKGVCRHRAYAFVVTALGLGIPSRMVLNEAHAWVEVYDGSLWRRIDLGGASIHLEQDDPAEGDRPPHVTQADPFPWPEGAEADSGASAAVRSRREGAMNGQGAPGADAPSDSPRVSIGEPMGPDADSGAGRARPTLTIGGADTRVMRGAPLRVEGAVSTELGACRHVRVNVLLRDARTLRKMEVGALSTDENGRFQGSVVVPLEIQVGEYELFVETPGDARCGPGESMP